MAKSSSGFAWTQAGQALFRHLGLRRGLVSPATAEQLPQQLLGTGYEVFGGAVVAGAFPAAAGIVGALAEQADGTWLALAGGDSGFQVLDIAGKALRPLHEHEAQQCRHIWLVSASAVSLPGVSAFLRRYKGRFVDLFLCSLLINLFALALPLFSSFVYDKILGNGITATLWALVIGLLLMIGIEFGVRMIRIINAERFAVSSEVEIDHGIFRQLLDLPINRMPAIGALLERYKQILSYRDFLSSSYLLALADLPFLLLFMAVIALAAGPLVFVGIICGLLMLLVGFLQLAPVLDYDRQAKQASEERLDLLASAVTGREAIVGARLRGLLQHRWEQASLTAAAAASKSRYWRGMGASLNTVISYASFIGVLALGVYLVEARQITAGGLLSASMLTSRMMNIFASVNTLLLRYREFKLALQEMNKMLPAQSMPVRLKTSAQLRGAVRLDRVTCRLQTNSAPVLENVSLTIAPGEIIGVAGAPGAGKTTLLRLLAGVLQPDEGQVLIDDIPLAQLQPEVIAANIGFKPQDYALFGTMIEDCVFAGREPPTPEQRHELLSHSGLARAFQENGLSWGTAIGPRGAHISGGQRQMVALARALAGSPTLLLLDEPTNGLDAPLENQLAQTLQQRAGRQTIIISTHSRAMLSICHRIIVVGQSRILADGPRSKVLVG